MLTWRRSGKGRRVMAEVPLDDEANAVREAVREFMMRQSCKETTKDIRPKRYKRIIARPRALGR